MFFRKKDKTELRYELDAVKAEIAAHPLSQDSIQQAQALIEEMRANGRDTEIEDELAKRHLPPAEEIGKLVAGHALSLARLNRKRIKLETKLGDIS